MTTLFFEIGSPRKTVNTFWSFRIHSEGRLYTLAIVRQARPIVGASAHQVLEVYLQVAAAALRESDERSPTQNRRYKQ